MDLKEIGKTFLVVNSRAGNTDTRGGLAGSTYGLTKSALAEADARTALT